MDHSINTYRLLSTDVGRKREYNNTPDKIFQFAYALSSLVCALGLLFYWDVVHNSLPAWICPWVARYVSGIDCTLVQPEKTLDPMYLPWCVYVGSQCVAAAFFFLCCCLPADLISVDHDARPRTAGQICGVFAAFIFWAIWLSSTILWLLVGVVIFTYVWQLMLVGSMQWPDLLVVCIPFFNTFLYAITGLCLAYCSPQEPMTVTTPSPPTYYAVCQASDSTSKQSPLHAGEPVEKV